MEISMLALIGIALATMFFGYFFGLLEGRGQGYKRGRKAAADERHEPMVSAAAHKPPEKVEKERGLLVLGLNETGRPQLQIDGRMVDAQGASADQRRRLIDLMVMLKPWVDPTSTSSSAPPKTASPAPTAQAAPQSPASASSLQGAAVEAPVSPPAVPVGKLSLVAQIDAILQTQLAGTPLAGKAIRLAESLHGGAVVFVGSDQYDGVDKVTDPEIQAAIRSAIAEWEKRFTPG